MLGSHLGRLGVLIVALTAVSFSTASAITVQLNPTKDNSLYEIGDGSLSNGSGEYLFSGAIMTGQLRRGLLAFDIAGNIPAGSSITSATLTLNVSKEPLSNVSPHSFTLHRVTQDWGEAGSDAGGPEGSGAPAVAGDATWLHTFFNTNNWGSLGGDFVAGASATTSVGPGLGLESWTGGTMATDVQGWLDNPANNFGWMIRGEEGTLASARRFDSKDLLAPGAVPVLEIEFSPPAPAASTWSMLIMTLLMLSAGALYLRRRSSTHTA